MVLHCDVVVADAVGTTVASVEAVGTITLNKDAKRVHAFLAQVVSTGGMTTAEAVMGQVIVDSKGLGLVDMAFDAGINIGGSPATNEQAVESALVKKNLQLAGDFGKVDIDVSYDAILPEPTSEVAVQFFTIYDDGDCPQKVIDALHQDFDMIVDFTARCSDDEIGDATSEVMDSTISVDGTYQKVVSYNANLAFDAVGTGDEHLLGYTEWTATFKGITPQKWPLPAVNPTLGTAVGSPVTVTPIRLPWYINKGNQKETLTPTCKLESVTSGANAVQVTLGVQE